MTRGEAIAQGLKKFVPIKPCIRGHLVIRTINGSCTECSRIRGRALYAKNIEKYREKGRTGEAYRRRKYPERYRAGLLRRLYGLSIAQYEAIWVSQGLACAICQSTDPGRKGVFAVDHDHETGRVRGILCGNCNNGLGRFKDKYESLVRAAEYLMVNK